MPLVLNLSTFIHLASLTVRVCVRETAAFEAAAEKLLQVQCASEEHKAILEALVDRRRFISLRDGPYATMGRYPNEKADQLSYHQMLI